MNSFPKDDVNIEINASEIKKITKAKSNLKIKIDQKVADLTKRSSIFF